MGCSDSGEAAKIHHCPSDNGHSGYGGLFVDFRNKMVLVQRVNDGGIISVTFPYIESAEISHKGEDLCECFSYKLEQLCGARYPMSMLYNTMNSPGSARRRRQYALFAVTEQDGTEFDIKKVPLQDNYEWIPQQNIRDRTDELLDEEIDCDGKLILFRSDGVKPWEEPGWLKTTVNDASQALKSLGRFVTGPFKQFQTTSKSTILRAKNGADKYVYLKSCIPYEMKTMKVISLFANCVDDLLYIDPTGGWMLMEDYGEILDFIDPRQSSSALAYGEVLKVVGKTQLRSIQHVSAFESFGLDSNCYKSLVDDVTDMLEDADIMKRLVERDGRQDAIKKEYLDNVKRLCRDLYVTSGLPFTIVHGDISESNVVKRGVNGCTQYTIIDWEHARVDLPLFDVVQFHYEHMFDDALTLENEAFKKGFHDYLDMWAKYADRSTLIELYEGAVQCLNLQIDVEVYKQRARRVDNSLYKEVDRDDSVRLKKTMDGIIRYFSLKESAS